MDRQRHFPCSMMTLVRHSRHPSKLCLQTVNRTEIDSETLQNYYMNLTFQHYNMMLMTVPGYYL